MTATIEQVEHFWDARPCNIRHGTAPAGTLEWSEQVTARKYFVEPHIPVFAQFSRWHGKRVLEIGCGIGTDSVEFLRAGAELDALDVSAASLNLAQQRAALHGVARGARFRKADAEAWLPDGPFDLVYSFGVLHHTPHPDRVLRGARARMKPDGELRIMLYAKWSIKNLLGQQPEAQANCPIAEKYTKKEVRRLVESCGFVVTSIAKTHIFPYRIADYVQHRYVKEWPYSWMGKRLFSWLERRLGWHLLIIAKPN